MRPARAIASLVLFGALLLTSWAGAQPTEGEQTDAPKVTLPPPPDEPAVAADAPCEPSCRTGFTCKAGRCVSLCNPPCPAGEVCVKGECQLRALPPPPPRRPRARHNYFGVGGGLRAAVNDSATAAGGLRAEFGSRYGAMQVGPFFGDKLIALRFALLGQVPLQPSDRLPLYIVPSLSLGYSFTWIDDAIGTRGQDIFMTPGIRLRYDLFSRIALFADLIQVEINFLHLQGASNTDFQRIKVVPVNWSFTFTAAFLY